MTLAGNTGQGQGDMAYNNLVILPDYEGDGGGGFEAGSGGAGSTSDRDPLFEEIARLVVQKDMASTSSLQRSYNIGYNRAGRIMDQLEAAGIPAGLIRVSCGLEDSADLIADIAQALK